MEIAYFKKGDNPNQMLVGKATCPKCKQEILIVNDQGLGGNRNLDYLENHGPNNELCMLSELFVDLLL